MNKEEFMNKSALENILPSVDEAGGIAVSISPNLSANEQALFIAGFQECIKWLMMKNETKTSINKENFEQGKLLESEPEISRLDFFTAHALTGILMENWQSCDKDQIAEAAIEIAQKTIEQLEIIYEK